MSNMIKTGCSGIQNVEYPNRCIFMSGNNEFVGHDVGDPVRVHHYSDVLLVIIHARSLISLSWTRLRILRLSKTLGQACTLRWTRRLVCLMLTDARLLIA
ncbi:hypothetical protein BDR07DRAFT_1420085 [Suillus spraguei]|nr:hypothetical protein BDR07DRAFT_1420085 [Suillus spraguei]